MVRDLAGILCHPVSELGPVVRAHPDHVHGVGDVNAVAGQLLPDHPLEAERVQESGDKQEELLFGQGLPQAVALAHAEWVEALIRVVHAVRVKEAVWVEALEKMMTNHKHKKKIMSYVFLLFGLQLAMH